jgi:site-specific DNA-methyltransferase (adenine-specific)
MAHIEIDDEVDDSVEVSDDEIVEESSGSYVLHHGEALAWLRSLSDGYADALVTDPPAGIAFMNKGWDHDKGGRTAWVAWLAEILREALRALKPGAAGFVWALPRTSHWTATACEDAGFEVRDVVTHVQGQGFPKSKALLKPAAEHWILVRAPGPLRPLRIDDCRVGTSKRVPGSVCKTDSKIYGKGFSLTTGDTPGSDPNVGRWPANFAMSHGACDSDACEADCPVRLLGEQSGMLRARGNASPTKRRRSDGVTGWGVGTDGPVDAGDTGTAARFFPCFYQPKASKRDRGEGNNHPTVKSVALMRWLVRLVCPVGGLVLDPFTGSGSTGVAALAEGLRFAGCEREAEYVQIARARLDKALP